MLEHLSPLLPPKERKMDEREASTSPIGNLTSKITSTLKRTDSIPAASSKTSEAGLPTRRQANGSSEMPAPSGRAGADEKPTSALTVVPPTEPATASDEALVGALQQLLGSRLEGVWRDRVVDGQWCGYVVGFTCRNADLGRLDEARALIEAANVPMDDIEAGKELAKMMAVTISSKSDLDVEAWTSVMLDDLREFPAFAIREACAYWRRNEKFLPTESELLEQCRYQARTRQALKRISFE